MQEDVTTELGLEAAGDAVETTSATAIAITQFRVVFFFFMFFILRHAIATTEGQRGSKAMMQWCRKARNAASLRYGKPLISATYTMPHTMPDSCTTYQQPEPLLLLFCQKMLTGWAPS